MTSSDPRSPSERPAQTIAAMLAECDAAAPSQNPILRVLDQILRILLVAIADWSAARAVVAEAAAVGGFDAPSKRPAAEATQSARLDPAAFRAIRMVHGRHAPGSHACPIHLVPCVVSPLLALLPAPAPPQIE